MQPHVTDTMSLFRLKPLKAATVSEISETTASSPTAAEDRVNFHIGNPVQDTELASAYLRIVLGLDVRREELNDENEEAIEIALGWSERDRPAIKFLKALIRKSAPYTPRGGFTRNNPNDIIKAFIDWLQGQPEPLSYDLGQTSGRREIVLATGGTEESLRILFHALSSSLAELPAQIFFHRSSVTAAERCFTGLKLERLADDEHEVVRLLEDHFIRSPHVPTFLVMGALLGEESRRALRALSLQSPLFFLEINDAPNHLSLAREAKLTQRVLRILTPGIFDKRFALLSTVFLAGNAEILSAFESMHFQLKGTPSASEIELLSYLRTSGVLPKTDPKVGGSITLESAHQPILMSNRGTDAFSAHTRRLEDRVGKYLDGVSENLEKELGKIDIKLDRVSRIIERHQTNAPIDPLSDLNAKEFLDELVKHIDSSEWHEELRQSLLGAFTSHHPEYMVGQTIVVSGSSRTALGLLGFHCGIGEVIIPDLSWSYEHCFPKVHAVPLTRDLSLDVSAMTEAVQAHLEVDERWGETGAVVFNNPHNATGRVFDESAIETLIVWLLERGVWVIDDLSYQEVAPSPTLPGIKTIRQLANRLVAQGRLT